MVDEGDKWHTLALCCVLYIHKGQVLQPASTGAFDTDVATGPGLLGIAKAPIQHLHHLATPHTSSVMSTT